MLASLARCHFSHRRRRRRRLPITTARCSPIVLWNTFFLLSVPASVQSTPYFHSKDGDGNTGCRTRPAKSGRSEVRYWRMVGHSFTRLTPERRRELAEIALGSNRQQLLREHGSGHYDPARLKVICGESTRLTRDPFYFQKTHDLALLGS